MLSPREQDLYGLERVLIVVITSIFAAIADATFFLVMEGLTFALLTLSMFAVSAVFVALARVRWRGVVQSERLASPGRGILCCYRQ